MVNLAIGLDIGGTKIRGVLFNGKRILLREDRQYTLKPPRKQEFLSALFGVADALIQESPRTAIRGIGVGTAGIVTGNKVFPGPNLAIVGRINIPQLLKQRYRLPVKLENDAKAAAFAESRLGAGRNADTMVMLTLGSGLGGAYVKDGIIQTGAFTSAYEMGFMIIDAGRAQKSMRGDFEWFGSEKFFISRGLDPLKAEMEARRGNKKLRLVWQEFGEYLGIGAASIINVLEPEVLVIGGGIAHAWPLFAPHMRNTAQRFIISPPAIQKTKIVKAKLGRDAGAIGAALLIHSRI